MIERVRDVGSHPLQPRMLGGPLLGLIPPTGWWDSSSLPHGMSVGFWAQILGVHQDAYGQGIFHMPLLPFRLSFVLLLVPSGPHLVSLLSRATGRLLKCGTLSSAYSPVCHLTMLFFRLLLKVTRWLLTLLLINPFYDIFQQLSAIYLRWNPASGDSSMLSALRSEYTGLERLIDDRTSLISPLSRNMHLGSSTMDEIVTIVRSSSIGGADTLVRTLLHLSAEATDIGKDLQAYSASIDSTVDE